MTAKIKIQKYDPTLDCHVWSDWFDTDSLELKTILYNAKDIKALVVCESMTREEAIKYLEKFK